MDILDQRSVYVQRIWGTKRSWLTIPINHKKRTTRLKTPTPAYSPPLVRHLTRFQMLQTTLHKAALPQPNKKNFAKEPNPHASLSPRLKTTAKIAQIIKHVKNAKTHRIRSLSNVNANSTAQITRGIPIDTVRRMSIPLALEIPLMTRIEEPASPVARHSSYRFSKRTWHGRHQNVHKTRRKDRGGPHRTCSVSPSKVRPSGGTTTALRPACLRTRPASHAS